MVPVIAQIEPVATVRAPAVAAGPARPVPAAAQSAASAEPARNPAPAAPPIPVVNGQEIHLTVESDTHEVIATLVDTETNAVIRQIPAEATRRARRCDPCHHRAADR